MRRLVLVAAAGLAAIPAVLALGHDHEGHRWAHLAGGHHAEMLADGVSLHDLEAREASRRAFARRVGPPPLVLGEEDHEHALMDTPVAGARRFAGKVYDSRNTDGQAGSGGPAVAYRPGGRVVDVRSRPDALLWRTGYGSWEPTIGLTKDGTIFFSARNTNIDPGVARSRDGGRTWEEKSPSQHELSLDPYLWVDRPTGRIWANDIEASITCPPLSWSDDQGETWTTSTVCGQFDHQSLFGGPPATSQPEGYPHVVYYCAISGGALAGSSTITGCSRSRDGGATFVPTAGVPYPPRQAPDGYEANPWCDGAAGHGVVDANGVVYLARGWCAEPYLAISRDEGDSWQRVRLPGDLMAPDAHEANVAVDAHGTIFVTWVSEKGRTLLTHSTDGGRTFTEPHDVTPPGVTSTALPNIDVGDPGRVAITVVGGTDAPTTPIEERTVNGYVITSVDATAADPTFYATTVNDPADPLWRGECGNLRCGNIGDFLDVVVAPDGTVWAAHVDSCPADGGRTCTAFGVEAPRGEAVAGQLVGGPPLVGTIAEQKPGVTLPPAAKPCRPARPLRVRIRRPKRGRITKARVVVNGKTVKRLRGRRVRRTVRIRRLPAGRSVVKVVVRTSTGRRVVTKRRYRTCG